VLLFVIYKKIFELPYIRMTLYMPQFQNRHNFTFAFYFNSLKYGNCDFAWTCLTILFFGPCIFNNEDKQINQQNAQINSGLIYY